MRPTDLDRRWLTIAQAAAATGRSESTIRRWIAHRRLRVLVVGGHRHVNERELLHLERATRTAARAGRAGARPPAGRMADALGMPPELRRALDR